MSYPIEQEIASALEMGRFAHLVFLVGSPVSANGSSACATVADIRDELILAGLREQLGTNDDLVVAELRQLFAKLAPCDQSPNELSEAVKQLPFEQFMSCLDLVAPDLAYNIVRLACCNDGKPFLPNRNHWAIGNIALATLRRRYVKTVTILTTNYDVGLDTILEKLLGETLGSIHEAPFPAYEASFGNGQRLRYAKLHGCIRSRSSLVYTFERLATGYLRPGQITTFLRKWKNTGEPTLGLSLGYGFNDPDLRPVLEEFFGSDRTQLIRTRYTPPGSASIQTHEPATFDDRLYGMDVLREETLARLNPRPLEADLLKHDLRNKLLEIENLVANPDNHFGNNPEPSYAGDGNREQAKIYLRQMSVSQIVHFAATLVNSCDRDDAAPVLAAYVKKTGITKLNFATADLFLHQFGHRHSMAEQAAKARLLWRHLASSCDIKLAGISYDSFSVFMNGERSVVTRVLFPMLTLWLGKPLTLHCSDDAFALYTHYDCHFWLKLLQRVDMQMPPHLIGFYRFCIRRWADRLALRLNRIRRDAERSNDARKASRTSDLLAQSLLLANEPALALRIAERAQKLASAQNAFHVVLSCDRTIGWCLLAHEGESISERALSVFARALLRSTYARDHSWRPKLGANFLRAALAYRNAPFGIEDLESKPCSHRQLIEALARLVKQGHTTQFFWSDVRVVCEDVLASCDNTKTLVRNLVRYSDVSLYPVLIV